MTDSNVVSLKSPVANGLTELLRTSARQMLAKALELEVSEFLAIHSDIKVDGKQAVVRSGYQPERPIQTVSVRYRSKHPKRRTFLGKV